MLQFIDPSKFREWIGLQQRSSDTDARGQAVGAWQDAGHAWAMLMPKNGREFFAADQMQAEVSMAWRIRYRAGVVPTMRVMDGHGVPYDIVAVVPSADRQYLDLMCLQGVRDGR